MFKEIKAIATDVDGVLTDGSFWWGAGGEELKRFCYADVTGIALARRAGIHLALISGESSESAMALVQRFADKLAVVNVYKGCHDKASAVREFADRHGVSLAETCFIGDDVPDLPAMEIVGMPVAPADAQKVARDRAVWMSTRNGGSGVLREVIDRILAEREQG